MTMIQQKFCAVLFRRNRIVVRVLQNLGISNIDFDASGGPRILADATRYN